MACADGMSKRATARHFNISPDTVDKAMAFSVPPGYRRTAPIKRQAGRVHRDHRRVAGRDHEIRTKRRHTAKRVYDRLRGEHGFNGGCTIIKDDIRDGTCPAGGAVGHGSEREPAWRSDELRLPVGEVQ